MGPFIANYRERKKHFYLSQDEAGVWSPHSYPGTRRGYEARVLL